MTASQRINPDWECTPADIQERIKAKEDLLLIDCRTRAERELVRIEDSLHIPQDELSANLETLFKQEEVSEMIVYCHHGVRSLAVVAALREAGFESVRSMAGGIHQWALEIDTTLPTY